MSDYWKENNIEKPRQVVVWAACMRGDIIIAGARHFDKVMVSQIKAIDGELIAGAGSAWTEGFIDQFGEFLSREQAMKIAIAAGQNVDIKRGCGGIKDTLFSEGLY